MSEKKSNAGRPTKYRKEYCEEIVKFFDREPFDVVMGVDDDGKEVVMTDKNGNVVMKPCKLPTFEGFAISIGVDRDTVRAWTENNPEFLGAYMRAKDYQKEILIQNGLMGNYEKQFAIFTAKNVTDMRDKQEIDHQSSDGSMSPNRKATEMTDDELAAIADNSK